MIEDLNLYGCEVEAENINEAQERFHEELEQNGFNYYETCLVFDNICDYDGYLEEEWYDDDED